MPKQRPHTSSQDQGTDPAFLRAVERRFGPIVWDLAAHAGNTVCGDRYFGPGSHWGEDSLERAWDWLPGVPRDGLRWLNYEFSHPKLWMPKVAREAAHGINLAVLGPASVSTEWFAEYVEGHALVLPLRPRVPFTGVAPNPKTGKVDPIPGGVMLMVYGPNVVPGFETWRWDAPVGAEVAA